MQMRSVHIQRDRIPSCTEDIAHKPLFRCPRSKVSRLQRRWLDRLRTELTDGMLSTVEPLCLCGVQNTGSDELLFSEDRYGLPFGTWLCHSCGMVRTSPMIADESLQRYYDVFYDNIYGPSHARFSRSLKSSIRLAGQQATWISDFWTASAPHILVADYGCGYGGSLVEWRSRGHGVLGYEVARDRIRWLSEMRLPVETDEFTFMRKCSDAELVILSHVLEHQSDPVSLLMRIASATPLNTHLYVELPGIFDWFALYRQRGFAIQHAHAWGFCLSTLQTVCSKAGWQLVNGDELIRSLWRKCSQPSVPSRDVRALCDRLLYSLGVTEVTDKPHEYTSPRPEAQARQQLSGFESGNEIVFGARGACITEEI